MTQISSKLQGSKPCQDCGSINSEIGPGTEGNTGASKASPQNAQSQLSALGYTPGDTVYFRAISKTKGAKKLEGTLEQHFNQLEKLNSQGCGIYFVVNGQGDTDKSVTLGHSLFFEHDNLPKPEQIALWSVLGLPEPTIQVDTGGKSIHSYWALKEPTAIEDWKILQSDLLEFSDADRTISNPSRVMRLAGFTHQGSGGESIVISNSGKRYDYGDLRSAVPKTKEEAKAKREPKARNQSSGDDIGKILSNDILPRLEGQQTFNWAGHEFTEQPDGKLKGNCPWHDSQSGTSFWVTPSSDGVTYSGACPTCTGNKKLNAIAYRYALKTGNPQAGQPTGTAFFDIVEELASDAGVPLPSYEWKGNRRGSEGASEQHENPKPTSGESIAKPESHDGEFVSLEVQRIVDGEFPQEQELALIQELAKLSGFSTYDITARVKAVKNALESADDRREAAQALPSLMSERNRRLDLNSYLWGDGGTLASMFHRRATEMKMPVEHLFTAFLPTSANFIPAGVAILVDQGFDQPLIFNAMILGSTGDGKSHAMKVAIGAAELIEKEERERYTILRKEFDADMERWNDTPKNERGEKPTKPIEQRRIYQTGGREALMKLHALNPNGLLWAKDEGEGFAASQNMNRGGKGDDLQQGLEDFNGGAYSKDLCTDGHSYYIPHRKIQKMGTMHITQLMKQLEADGFEDYRGDQARWLFCAVPFGERKLDLTRCNAPKINKVLTQRLKNLYEDLETLEPNPDGYLFDDAAYSNYAAYQHQLRDWSKAEVGSLSAAFPKMEQYCIRLAGLLHILNSKLANVKPAPTIDARTMRAAIDLTDFYIGQQRLIYASALPGQALAGLMLEVQQFCQEKATPLTPGKIRAGSRALKAKIDGPTMKQIVEQLVKSGYGEMNGSGYVAFPELLEPEEETVEYEF